MFTSQIQPLTAFSSFTVSGAISGTTGFAISGRFGLGGCSNGVNPLTEVGTLPVVTYTVAIPSGSFVRTRSGGYAYEGTIAGAHLQVRITPVGATTYSFSAEASGANLAGTTHPVSVGLTIWDDAGTTALRRRIGDD